MAKLSDEIFKDLAKRKGKPSDEEEEPEDMAGEGDEEDTESEGGDEEAAMQEFIDAEDAKGKAAALKSFLKICYPNLGE